MSAETLRNAAALMRKRAEAAEKVHKSPWKPMGAKSVVYPMTKRISGTVAESYPTGGSQQQAATTEHIASWHPVVALAVADWLDRSAYLWDFGDIGTANKEHALAVATAYLGSDQ